MEKKACIPHLSPLTDRDGRLLMFGSSRLDKELAKKDLFTLTDLIDQKLLPVGNTVLISERDKKAVPTLLPRTLDDIHLQYTYRGSRENETAFNEEFAEGVSFGTDLLTQKPHLLFTLRGMFYEELNHSALTNALPYAAGVEEAGFTGDYHHQQHTYQARHGQEQRVNPNALRYCAFMHGITQALDTTSAHFQEKVPASNPYLASIGITDVRKKPRPEQLAQIRRYYDIAQQVAYISGLIELSSDRNPNTAINKAHDVAEMVRERLFRHAQSRQHHHYKGLIHDALLKMWWDEKNPYQRYERWFVKGDDRVPLTSLFPGMKEFEAASLEAMLRDDAYLMFTDVPLHPDTTWYEGNPKLKEIEMGKRADIMQAHRPEFWEKNALWLMFESSDSYLLSSLDRIREEYRGQLDQGEEIALASGDDVITIPRNPEFMIPEDPGQRVDYALKQTEHGWWDMRFLSDQDKRLFVARHILSPIEFRTFIKAWQEQIQQRVRVEKDFTLTKLFIEEQMEAMGWMDLYDEEGRPDLSRFDSEVPFWVSGYKVQAQERVLMEWEKIKRLFHYYQLLPEEDLAVVDQICAMAGR